MGLSGRDKMRMNSNATIKAGRRMPRRMALQQRREKEKRVAQTAASVKYLFYVFYGLFALIRPPN
ncbi:hypothetical protein [Shinella sp.]|uniref:hypothetical protein n=1 Tax=Shinella sp. TaxID=1870904 RepID=UPI0029C0397F|nr:hypothetical protein [Shinella sp.]